MAVYDAELYDAPLFLSASPRMCRVSVGPIVVQGGATPKTYTMRGVNNSGVTVYWTATGDPDFTGAQSGLSPAPTRIVKIS